MTQPSGGGSVGPIRVLIVDDSRVLRMGLAMLLGDAPDLTVVGEAADGESAIDAVRRLNPDVVLMDVNLPRVSGVETTRRLKSEFPAIYVIGLSLHDAQHVADELRAAGAAQYIVKGGDSDELCRAIRECRADTTVPCPVPSTPPDVGTSH